VVYYEHLYKLCLGGIQCTTQKVHNKKGCNEQDADDILQDILVEAVNGNIKFGEKKKEDKKEKP